MNRHSIDKFSLTFGLIFVAATAWWLLVLLIDVALAAVAWFAAGTLILLGLAGIIAAVRSELVRR